MNDGPDETTDPPSSSLPETPSASPLARVSAVALGAVFMGGGTLQLFTNSAGGSGIVTALVLIGLGFQFAWSGATGKWNSLFLSWNEPSKYPQGFLLIEPETPLQDSNFADEPRTALQRDANPYAPPRTEFMFDEKIAPAGMLDHFLEGEPFIHYGVVYFLDPEDATTIHAALPLVAKAMVSRNVDEAVRRLPEFLATLPNSLSVVSERSLVIRMIASYQRLHDEVHNRVVVSWDELTRFHGDPHRKNSEQPPDEAH